MVGFFIIIIILIINVLLLSAKSHFVDLLRSTRYENKNFREPKSNLYINLRRSRDGAFVRSCVWSSGVSYPRFFQFGLGNVYADCPHKRSIYIMKVDMDRKNMQLELIRFREKCRIYSCLLFRTEGFYATRVFTLG